MIISSPCAKPCSIVHMCSYTMDRNFLGPVMTHHHAAFVPLTKQAVADILGISVRSVENWINEGILPAPAKLGGRVYWHPDLFYSWMSNRLLEAPTDVVTVTPVSSVKNPRQRGSDTVGEDLHAKTERKLARLQASL
jgi:hypothetical protein